MPSTTINPYLRTRVLTASPEELRLLLLEGAIRFARQGREGLANKDYEASFTGLSSCRDIIVELITSMRPEVDPELCDRLHGLYTFMYNELVEASLERNPSRVDTVIQLLEFEHETWVMLMRKLAQERGSAGPTSMPPEGDHAAAHPPGTTTRAPLSVQA